MIFSFFLFNDVLSIPSLEEDISVISKENIASLIEDENYVSLVIEKPEIVHEPEMWRTAYSDADKKGSSIREIVENLGGSVYINSPEYAHTKILIPKENTDELVDKFVVLGFEVRNNTFLKLQLSDSRELVKVPLSVVSPSGSSFTLNGQGTIIAVIDSGIDDSHLDLDDGKIVDWRDYVLNEADPYDNNGHGTHCASIAAGTGEASFLGLYKGIAPAAELIGIRACYGMGHCEKDYLANGIRYAVDHNADVISISSGEPEPHISWCDCSSEETDVHDLCDAIQYALGHDVPVVAAAGNDGSIPYSINWPACIEDVIAVGAAHKDVQNTYFYQYMDWLPVSYPRKIATIHARITIPTDSLTPVFDEEWDATYEKVPITNEIIVSGFQRIVYPQNWPATIKVEVEAQHKHRNCYESEKVWWDPGWFPKGDKYWVFTEEYEYDENLPGVVVEIGARPYGETGGFASCWFDDEWWKIYYEDFICRGTPNPCDFFNYIENGCKNQPGCSWNSGNNHCEGTPIPCEDRYSFNGYICGTPATTGCEVTAWSLIKGKSVKIFRVNSWEGVPILMSCRGPSIHDFSLTKPLVTAPGENICAAKATGTNYGESNCGDGDYASSTGTSMATPMVAGEIALLKQLASRLGTHLDIYRITSCVKQAEQKVYDCWDHGRIEGFGRINVLDAAWYLCPDCESITWVPPTSGSGGGGGGGCGGGIHERCLLR